MTVVIPIKARMLDLPGVMEITPVRHGDERGYFTETWSEAAMRELGIDQTFVQDNESWSREKGTLRGLHYQRPPMAQAKLVRVSRGRVFDVVVDIRTSSPSFGRWAGVELSAERGNQLFIPEGFAHGLITLEPDTVVNYKVGAPYSREHDRGIRHDDPDIGINWPVPSETRILSPKDRAAPGLREQDTGF